MKKIIILILLIISNNSFADDDKAEILQDLVCELNGTVQSNRDGIPSQKNLPLESVSVKVKRSIEEWNKDKKNISIIITPKSEGKVQYDYLIVLGRFNKNQYQKNVWYENTEDSYEITEINGGKNAPSDISNIKIDRITGKLYFRYATIGSYSAIKNITGKCIQKDKARVL